jgi:hypothetical protein
MCGMLASSCTVTVSDPPPACSRVPILHPAQARSPASNDAANPHGGRQREAPTALLYQTHWHADLTRDMEESSCGAVMKEARHALLLLLLPFACHGPSAAMAHACMLYNFNSLLTLPGP